MTLPNALTLLRIFIAPLLVVVLLTDSLKTGSAFRSTFSV
jgi:phosphatidylglycerophosphate synthase